MSSEEAEKRWIQKAISTTWYGEKVGVLDRDQLLAMIGYFIEEVDSKNRIIDNYLGLMEKNLRLKS